MDNFLLSSFLHSAIDVNLRKITPWLVNFGGARHFAPGQLASDNLPPTIHPRRIEHLTSSTPGLFTIVPSRDPVARIHMCLNWCAGNCSEYDGTTLTFPQ